MNHFKSVLSSIDKVYDVFKRSYFCHYHCSMYCVRSSDKGRESR